MATISALPKRLDIVVVGGDSLTFSTTLGENIAGVSLTATLFYFSESNDGTQAVGRTLGLSVTNATTGALTISLSGTDTNYGSFSSSNPCQNPFWYVRSSTRTYIIGLVTAVSPSACTIDTFTSSVPTSGGIFL